jgi:hypothetical protein
LSRKGEKSRQIKHTVRNTASGSGLLAYPQGGGAVVRSANRRCATTVASPLRQQRGGHPALLDVRLLDDVVRLGQSPKQFALLPRALVQ